VISYNGSRKEASGRALFQYPARSWTSDLKHTVNLHLTNFGVTSCGVAGQQRLAVDDHPPSSSRQLLFVVVLGLSS